MILIRFVLLIVHPHNNHETETNIKDKNDPIDRKLAGFGYSVGISI